MIKSFTFISFTTFDVSTSFTIESDFILIKLFMTEFEV